MKKIFKILDDKNHLGGTNEMGLYYLNKNNIDKAIKYFEKNLKIDNECVYSFVNLGICFVKLNEDDQAKKMFEEAIKKNNTNAMVGLAQYYERKKNSKEALKYYEMAEKKGHKNLGQIICRITSRQFEDDLKDNLGSVADGKCVPQKKIKFLKKN